jgi:hypothetical protein
MVKSKQNTIEVLLVENNPEKIGLLNKLLSGTKISYKLHIVNDVEETHQFLNKKDKHRNAPTPDAVLLTEYSSSKFKKKMDSFLNKQVLEIKITNDKIVVTKANNRIIGESEKNNTTIAHFLNAILALKKFASSLIVSTDEEI